MKYRIKFLALLLADILLAATLTYGVYYAVYEAQTLMAPLNADQNSISAADVNPGKTAGRPASDYSSRFRSHFTKTTKITKTSYTSQDVSIKVARHTLGTGADKITYYLADIYLAHPEESFRTCFAQDTYGVGYKEDLTKMTQRNQGILGLNGDSYCYNQQHLSGPLIRNGLIYRDQNTSADVCVLYRDGQMKTYTPESFDSKKAVAEGAYQTWLFGPSLLDEQGRAKRTFNTWGYILKRHPRTAIGYYEPGHYCFITADGRQPGYSKGMTLTELSKIFEQQGCRSAYNLDGGHTTFMTFRNTYINQSYKPGKTITDCIYICEPGTGQGGSRDENHPSDHK